MKFFIEKHKKHWTLIIFHINSEGDKKKKIKFFPNVSPTLFTNVEHISGTRTQVRNYLN